VKDWTVREARSGDWPAVASLLTAAGLPLAGIEENLTGFLVAVHGETVIECAAVEHDGRAGLLRSVAVAEAERGSDLGQELVHRSLEWAASAGLETVTLLMTTAGEFFPRFGLSHAGPCLPPSRSPLSSPRPARQRRGHVADAGGLSGPFFAHIHR